MKLGLISDIHMSNSLPHARPVANGVTDRLVHQREMWKAVWRVAKRSELEGVLILGDLFDQALVDPVTLSTTVDCLSRAPCPVHIMGGNHDANGDRFLVEAFRSLGGKLNYLSAAKPFSPDDWLHFWTIPYCETEKARELLRHHRAQASVTEGVNILLLHHSIVGCLHAGWKCDDGLEADEVTPPEFARTYSGHFHEHQKFGIDGKGMYLSAPMHHRFDDVGRGAWWWAVDFLPNGDTYSEKHDPGAPKFHSWEWGEKQPPAMAGDYVRIRVEATSAEYAKIKHEVYEQKGLLEGSGVHVKIVHKPVYHHAARIKASKAGGLTFRDAVDSYVAAPDVDITGLDSKRLKKLGQSFLGEAEKRWASSSGH